MRTGFDPRRTIVWALAIAFVIAGMYLAWTRGFEQWAGRGLERAAPQARRALPSPARHVLRETKEHLPVYGRTSQWLARKSLSIVYFAIVGWFALAVRRRKPESLAETLLVTVVAGVGMSTIIEILEAPFGEQLPSQLFDIGCGAVGGLVSGTSAWLVSPVRHNGPAQRHVS